MGEVIKKSSILNRLKNIVAKTRRMLSWRGKIKDEQVSAFDARDIQQDVYNHLKNIKHNTYTPPYIELAAQLLVNEQQIFEAAATHLTTIAKARRKYAPEMGRTSLEIYVGHGRRNLRRICRQILPRRERQIHFLGSLRLGFQEL